jgi:hypothetical protein
MDITELLTAPSSPRLQEGVPYDAYARIPALRSGVLKDGIVRGAEREPIISPRHIKASYEGHVDRDSESMLFGRAMHTLLLEPKEFENRYCFYEGRRDERTKAYQEFLVESAGKEVLKATGPLSWAWCMEAAVELCSNATVQPFISAGAREVTGLAPICGLPCKIRIDWLSITNHCLCDVKTTRDVGPLEFWQHSFKTYSYGLQLSLYREVYRLITDQTLPVFIIAIENHPPFVSVVYEVPGDLLDHELRLVTRSVEAVKKCLLTGQWPSFARNEVLPLAVPDWALPHDDLVDWED